MTEPKVSDMVVTKSEKSIWRNLSLIWLVPLITLAISLFIGWQTWSDRGSLIQIRFDDAAGVTAGETTLRYRNVTVGQVEKVNFSPDLKAVNVSLRVDKAVANALPSDAEFWVVTPEVSTSGISGLSTVLSGVYIETAFTPEPGAQASEFVGLDRAPLVATGVQGTRITLRAQDGHSLTAGAPIFHRGIEVGKIETPRLMTAGDGVIIEAFVKAPYDALLTTATRFWQTPGIDFNFGPGGLDLSVGSLAGLLRGGVTFDSVFAGGEKISASDTFELYPDEAEARSSVFHETINNAVDMVVEFDQSVSGLKAGSDVMYGGVRIGSVSRIGAYIATGPMLPGQSAVRLRAQIAIDPQRLGLSASATAEEAKEFFSREVTEGLRARLAAQGLFSQALIIELVNLPDAEPAELLEATGEPPLLPSVPSELPDVAATAEGLLTRIDNLPVEELLNQAISTMAAIEAVAADDKLREAPDAFVALLDQTRELVGSDATKALPGELQTTVAELRKLFANINDADTVDKLVAAVDATYSAANTVSEVADDFSAATSEVPDLIADLRKLTEKANALEVEAFLSIAGEFLAGADRLIDTPEARALPQSLTNALDEASGALADLRKGDLIDNSNAAIASARDAAAAVEEAVKTLPSLSRRMERLIAETETVITGYGPQSPFSRETRSMLAEVRKAAEALSKLARSIERDPNSILFGK